MPITRTAFILNAGAAITAASGSRLLSPRGPRLAGEAPSAFGPVEASSTARAASRAKRAVNAVAARFPGQLGVYVRTMADEPPLVTLRADERFAAASVIKLVIMVTAYRAFERAPALRRRAITIRASDRIGGSPLTGSTPARARFTLQELVHAMIVASDNSASNALITQFGFNAINATAARFGLRHTRLARHFVDEAPRWQVSLNVTSPRDMGELMYLIERGTREGETTVASPEICHEMVELMLGQWYREMIPAGVPRGVRVADKVGAITGVRNDVAIVEPFGDAPYVIAVLSRKVDDYRRAIRGISEVSRAVYLQYGIGTE